MKFNKKSAIAMMLAGCTVFGLAGCGSPEAERYPQYADDKVMMIGGWDPPIPTLEDYQMAKDMGLTHMFIDNVFAAKGTELYLKQLELCEQVGIKAIVGMDTSLDNAANKPEDLTDYSSYSAVEMINVWDEPGTGEFEAVKQRILNQNKIYADQGKDMVMYVNLNPTNPTSFANGGTGGTTSTEDYLTKFCTEVLPSIQGRKILSTDVYALKKTVFNENVIDDRWVERLSTYGWFAKEYDCDFHFFLQSYSAGNERDIVDKADLTFQVYTDMAFGVNAFSWFTYRKSFLDGFGGGCVENNVSTTKTYLYDWVQEVNEELASFDHVYLSFDWEGVMPILGTLNTADDPEYENSDFVNIYEKSKLSSLACGSVTSTQDALVGQFKDKDGNCGLMVTNYTEPTQGLNTRIDFNFTNANRAIVYRNGLKKVYEVKDGKLNLNLESGEGMFVIPVQV